MFVSQVLTQCQRIPAKIALARLDEQPVTYGEIYRYVAGTMSFFRDLGISSGNPVLLAATKQWGFVYAYLALHALNAVAVPLSPNSTDSTVAHAIRISGARIGFWPEGRHDLLPAEFLDKIQASDECIQLAAHPEALADLMFTSGTTGAPKAVCLTHGNIAASIRNINIFVGNTQDDIEINPMPLSHSFGIARMRCTLAQGGTMVAVDGMTRPKVLFQAMKKFKATGLGMVGPAWIMLHRLSGNKISAFRDQLRYMELGSAPLTSDEKACLASLLPSTHICMHYGLTEASRAAFLDFHADANHLNTVGKASPLCEISIFTHQGIPAPSGGEGEICVRGPMVTTGYWNQIKSFYFYGDWFRTGDLGRITPEGYLVLTGRIKEMINVGGEKVAPAEVEAAARQLLHVQDACCIAARDAVLGQSVALFLQCDQSSPYTLEEVRRLLRDMLEPYKLPQYLYYINSIPKTDTGKLQRLALRQSLPEEIRPL